MLKESHKEATTGFEPVIKVLQTCALPLGHVAMNAKTGIDPQALVYISKKAGLSQPEIETRQNLNFKPGRS